MTGLSPTQLLAELQALTLNPPKDLDETIQTKLYVAAKSAFLSLEKPEDVVARVLLSQVRKLSTSLNKAIHNLKLASGGYHNQNCYRFEALFDFER
jgi:hypothetical protein